MAGAGPGADQHLEAGSFLVAAPEMRDPRFSRTVILIVHHSAEGSMGLIVNKRSNIPVTDALPELETAEDNRHVLYFGGPVQPAKITYAYTGGRSGAADLEVLDNVYLGTSYSQLQDLIKSRGKNSLRVYFGYAGWGPGQLEFELSLSDWQLTPASAENVFNDDTENLWRSLNRENSGVMTRYPGPGIQPYL